MILEWSYQQIMVLHDIWEGQKELYLDGVLQMSDHGEATYHEMMAHVPLLSTKSS